MIGAAPANTTEPTHSKAARSPSSRAGLYNWRDGVAREEDESTGYVLSRANLIKLAQAVPSTVAQVSQPVSHCAVTTFVSVLVSMRVVEAGPRVWRALAPPSWDRRASFGGVAAWGSSVGQKAPALGMMMMGGYRP